MRCDALCDTLQGVTKRHYGAQSGHRSGEVHVMVLGDAVLPAHKARAEALRLNQY
eukprot:COSAG02_NODE_333_length_24452_cov_12.756703_13_plen_55_part_00